MPLHELLEHQAYRLAFWRTALDEINYRRFFDVNDLAALRMEEPRVFRDTHGLLKRLIAGGRRDRAFASITRTGCSTRRATSRTCRR